MAIEINGKIYRNLQEQVAENQKDIERIEKSINLKYKHNVVLRWSEDGEEPDWTEARVEFFDDYSEPYTLTTLYDMLKEKGMKTFYFGKFDEGNHHDSYGAIITNRINVYVNVDDELTVFAYVYRIYEGTSVAESTSNFQPTSVRDVVE